LKLWSGALLVGVALLTAAACGGDEEEGAGTTTPTTATAQKGGTLKVNLEGDTDYVDPALAYYQVSWQFEYATGVKLLNYPDKPAPEGSTLQPEGAVAMPTVSQDGKTYTFKVKPGFRFSPPSNAEVTARSYVRALERALNPKQQSPAASFVKDIVGAEAYLDGKADSISGVKVNGDQLAITLTQAAPDFIARIAMPFFMAIPENTPISSSGLKQVASAGPYYISKWSPKRELILKRNPNYTGDRTANVDEIRYTVGVNQKQGQLMIEKSQADYAADGLPPAAQGSLAQRFGPSSQAAKDGRQQYFVNPALTVNYLALNTSRPLFKDVKLRQAVNYAIDRIALLRQSGAFAGEPTDQYLPPTINGYQNEEIYPFQPDVAKAKELAGTGSHGTAMLYTCNSPPCPERAQIVQANLEEIGIDVQIKQFDRSIQFQKEGVRGEPFDIADEGWIADYPDPYDFLNILLDGTNIQETNNVNFAYFNAPQWNTKLQEAAVMTGDERFERYGRLDVELARDAAPWAAWSIANNRDFFSERVGCQVYQPTYGMSLASLCMRSM
jgi:ABC-type oligopeptide transport system substrate-binding subunit